VVCGAPRKPLAPLAHAVASGRRARAQVLLDRVERFIRVVGAKEDAIFQRRARMLQRDKQRRARDGPGGRGRGGRGGGSGRGAPTFDRGMPGADRGTPGGQAPSHVRWDDRGVPDSGDQRGRDRGWERERGPAEANGRRDPHDDRGAGDSGGRRGRERGRVRDGDEERARGDGGGVSGSDGGGSGGGRREQRGPGKWTAGAPSNAFVAAMRVVPPTPGADGQRSGPHPAATSGACRHAVLRFLQSVLCCAGWLTLNETGRAAQPT